MPERKFVNPLTQRSSAPETFTDTSTAPETFPALPRIRKRKRRFEDTHDRVTLWLDRDLKTRFEALAAASEQSKAALLDEAITDLLNKYRHP